MEGWIKLHRKIITKAFMRKPNYLAVWIYLLIEANHTESEIIFKNEVMKIPRGTCLTSISQIARYFRLGIKSVYNILNYLENENQIEKRSTNAFTLISIINYEDYQQNEKQFEKQGKNEGKAREKRGESSKNVKNEKNERENIQDCQIYAEELTQNELPDFFGEPHPTHFFLNEFERQNDDELTEYDTVKRNQRQNRDNELEQSFRSVMQKLDAAHRPPESN